MSYDCYKLDLNVYKTSLIILLLNYKHAGEETEHIYIQDSWKY